MKGREEKKEDVEANIPIAITARYSLSCDTLMRYININYIYVGQSSGVIPFCHFSCLINAARACVPAKCDCGG